MQTHHFLKVDEAVKMCLVSFVSKRNVYEETRKRFTHRGFVDNKHQME